MAQPEGHPVKMIEQVQISPAHPNSSLPASSSLPLTFFDIPGAAGISSQRVTFYEFPDHYSSSPNFEQSRIISALKSSICIALEKFYPFAAKIVMPPLPGKPQIIYDEGGSIPFTVAESMVDLQELIGDDPQDVKLLHPLLPLLAPWRTEDDGSYIISPLLAIQVTLFPNNSGMCIGVQFDHGVCDGRSLRHFMKSWASICRTGDHQIDPLPFLDRTIVQDPTDILTTFLNAWWVSASSRAHASHIAFTPHSPTDQRATFTLPGATIARLKGYISNRSTVLGLDPMNISSFAAACAFTWVCIVKSTFNDDTNPNPKPQLCHFLFVAECRTLLETPLPETYFGNCIVPRLVAMEKRVMVGPDGVVLCARAIAEEVKKVKNGGALRGVEKTMHEFADIFSRFGRPLSVAGSPHVTEYETDFGWGKPRKSVIVHIDVTGSIGLEKSRDEDGGLEIGVVLSKAAMDVFTMLFNQLESSLI